MTTSCCLMIGFVEIVQESRVTPRLDLAAVMALGSVRIGEFRKTHPRTLQEVVVMPTQYFIRLHMFLLCVLSENPACSQIVA